MLNSEKKNILLIAKISKHQKNIINARWLFDVGLFENDYPSY